MKTGTGRVMSIDRRSRSIAAASPSRPAVVVFAPRRKEHVVTWLELDRESAKRAHLLDRGLGSAGAIVAFDAPSCAETLIRILACLRSGVTFLPLDPKAPPGERARLLAAAAQRNQVWLWDGQQQIAPEGPDPSLDPRRASFLLASGSSSGRPRLIAVPAPACYDPARVPNPLLRATGWASGQRQLIVGPLYHAAPFTTCVEGLLDGNTLLLQETFTPREALHIIDEHAVEWMELTPTHMQWMLMAAERDRPDLGSLRAIVHTAARCPATVKQGWIDLLGPLRVFEFYGATEGVGFTLVRGDEWLRRPGTVGRGFCTQIKIVDDRGREAPAGSAGTVYMRRSGFSPAQAASGGAVTRAVDGFSTVGDHGWVDEQRYLYLCPRREDMVVVGGSNVYPAEVESVLADHPGILDSAVVGTADDLVGVRLAAFVVARPGARLEAGDILAFCAERLARHKVPVLVHLVDHVPRSDAGKLQRWRLRGAVDALAQRTEEDGHE
jgi:bile acid-coenzyme A ligase